MYPPHIFTRVGLNERFRCTSIDEVTWKYNGTHPPPSNTKTMSLFREQKYFLIIEDVQLYNAGSYVCYGRMSERIYFSATGTLEFTGKLQQSTTVLQLNDRS